MTDKNYTLFSSEDFASDSYFQKWILEDDPKTHIFWEKWLADNPEKQEDIDLAKKIIHQFRFKKYKASQLDFDEVWESIKETQTKSEVKRTPFMGVNRKKWYVSLAATVSIIVAATYALYFDGNLSNEPNENKDQVVSPTTASTIEPGTDKAILTLADGSAIELTQGKIYHTQNARSNGKQIEYHTPSATEEITYNYLTIPRGGQFFVTLADGTKVWLNSESKLKFPVAFHQNSTRTVQLLYGEAYFDVSHSDLHNGTSFVVESEHQRIEVLGTGFNIKAYKDDDYVYTTLVEGKIALNTSDERTTLSPNKQVVLNKETKNIKVAKVDASKVILWRNGIFSFRGATLREITKVLSRWYDVDFVIQDEKLYEITFKGVLGKDQKIEDILTTIISASELSNFEIENKTITIK